MQIPSCDFNVTDGTPSLAHMQRRKINFLGWLTDEGFSSARTSHKQTTFRSLPPAIIRESPSTSLLRFKSEIYMQKLFRFQIQRRRTFIVDLCFFFSTFSLSSQAPSTAIATHTHWEGREMCGKTRQASMHQQDDSQLLAFNIPKHKSLPSHNKKLFY